METMTLPKGVTVIETGIGGMAIVQELQRGYDALIVADCVDHGRPPGRVMMIIPDVIDVNEVSLEQRMDLLADMHLAKPERVFMMSKALGVLPAETLMVGCQPEDAETPGKEMSDTVAAAVDVAIAEILRHIAELRAKNKAAKAAKAEQAAEAAKAASS